MVMSKITGTGRFLPEKKLTNFDLEKMVDTSDKWIIERSGIKERRIANEEQTCSYMGTMAVKKACEKANIDVKNIDFMICTTNSPDNLFPATAMKILQQLELTTAPGMDVQAGCTSFVYGLELADGLLKASNRYKNIALVAAEKLTQFVDWEDRNTCVLFGDGSGAAIITSSENGESDLISSYLGGDPTKTHAIKIDAGLSLKPASEETVKNREHFIKMEGQDVFKFAVKIIPKCVKNVLKQANMSIDDIKLIIPHQANARIIEASARLLKVPIEKFYMNIEKYGNTSSASIPIALDEAIDKGKLNRGDYFITVGFGAGLTYAASLIKY